MPIGYNIGCWITYNVMLPRVIYIFFESIRMEPIIEKNIRFDSFDKFVKFVLDLLPF